MKKTLTSIIIGCAVGVAMAQSSVTPAIPRDAKMEAKIEKTLIAMHQHLHYNTIYEEYI